MSQISLAKALKLKKRFVGRLSQLENDIRSFNSHLDGQIVNVNIPNLFLQRINVVNAILQLKQAIFSGNAGIQNKIYELGEKKSTLTWLRTIPTTQGISNHLYGDKSSVYIVSLTKLNIDELCRKLELEIDVLQDEIDTYNYMTKITVDVEIFDLLK